MSFTRLELENFRIFSSAEFSFPESGITLITGPNGSGKSTILEALYFLCMGKNPREIQLSNLLHRETARASPPTYFSIHGSVPADDQQTGCRSISFLLGSPVSYRDGDRAVRRSEWIGRPPIVLFSSGELGLVIGEPAQRRKFMDRILSQEDSEYLSRLRRYTRTLEERNALLKSTGFYQQDSGSLLALDETLAQDGEFLTAARRTLIQEMMDHLSEKLLSLGSSHLGSRLRLQLMESARGNMLGLLLERRLEDQSCGHTTVGPHRDDIHFLDMVSQGGRTTSLPLPASSTLSQGEIRILALALKCLETDRLRRGIEKKMAVAATRAASDRPDGRMGSFAVSAGGRAELPVLLLDDIFSELDDQRRLAVSSFIQQYPGQIFLTSCLPPPDQLLQKIRRHISIS